MESETSSSSSSSSEESEVESEESDSGEESSSEGEEESNNIMAMVPHQLIQTLHRKEREDHTFRDISTILNECRPE